jgi:hypothetical protein
MHEATTVCSLFVLNTKKKNRQHIDWNPRNPYGNKQARNFDYYSK